MKKFGKKANFSSKSPKKPTLSKAQKSSINAGYKLSHMLKDFPDHCFVPGKTSYNLK